MSEWQLTDTTTHQDHVIAHVLGATVLGHFVVDEAIHLVLDIGFIWTIFLDTQMSLLPHGVAVVELDVEKEVLAAIQLEVDGLLSSTAVSAELSQVTRANALGEITAVEVFEREDERRLLLVCEETNLAIETSLTTAEIKVYEC